MMNWEVTIHSFSKGAAELIIRSYYKSYFINKKNIRIGVARAGNVIGGGDWSENRLIPDCIKAWSKGKKLLLETLNQPDLGNTYLKL